MLRLLGRVHGVVCHFSLSPPLKPSFPELMTPTTPWAPGWICTWRNFNGLLVTATVVVEGPDEFELEPHQASGISAVDPDEGFIQMALAMPKELEACEAGSDHLNSQ